MTGQIVVGWTDSEEGRAALDWAVHQSLLTSRGVVLAHEVFDGEVPGGPGNADDQQLLSRARREGDVVRQTIAREFPELEFRAEVEWEEPAAGLLRWSRSADILAVGAPSNRHQRLLGALTDHLAAAAESPVALVPSHWRSNLTGSRSVVVGATATVTGRAALKFATQEAVRMSAALVAIIGGDCRTQEGRATLGLVNAVAIDHPGLAVEARWEEGDPVSALVAISHSAQLIVLGTHHSSDRWSIRLGPVTEMVLGRAVCPVVTVARLHTGAESALFGPG